MDEKLAIRPDNGDGLVSRSGPLGSLVDPVLGIVSGVEQRLEQRGSNRLHSAHAAAADLALTVGYDGEITGGGIGTNEAQAWGRAIGEAVERYSALYIDTRRLLRCTAHDLDAPHIDPARLQLFSPQQTHAWAEASQHGGKAVGVMLKISQHL